MVKCNKSRLIYVGLIQNNIPHLWDRSPNMIEVQKKEKKDKISGESVRLAESLR